MSAQRFTLRRGDSLSVIGLLRRDASPQSLVGYELEAFLQDQSSGSTTPVSAEITDAAAGQFRVHATPVLTQDLSPGMHLLVTRLVLPGSGLISSVGAQVWVTG